jgi:hypothetical protein
MAPRRIESYVAWDTSDTIQLYPLWPAAVRLSTTPAGGIRGKCIYVHEGAFENIPVEAVKGQIAVMEITGGRRWRMLFAFVARAVILLGSPGQSYRDWKDHHLQIPLDMPRFYVPDGPDADRLRQGTLPAVHCVSRVKWQQCPAANIFALIPPRRGSPQSAARCVMAPLDAMGMVPDMTPGADHAVDIATALVLLERMAAAPPRFPVLFAFVDAHFINHRGMREMLLSLAMTPSERESMERVDSRTAQRYRLHNALLDSLQTHTGILERLYEKEYSPLHRYIKEEIQKEVLAFDAMLQPLRLKTYSTEPNEVESLRSTIDSLQGERNRYFAVQKSLLEKGSIDERHIALAREIWQRAQRRIRGQYRTLRNYDTIDRQRETLRRRLIDALGREESEENPVRPIQFLVGLDLSDAGVATGVSLKNDYLKRLTETANARVFCRWLLFLSRDTTQSIWPEHLLPALNLTPLENIAPELDRSVPSSVNLSPLTQLESLSSYAIGDIVNPTVLCPSYGVPAVSWSTLEGYRDKIDTPADRPELLDWSTLGPQVDATVVLLQHRADDSSFIVPEKQPTLLVNCAKGVIVDQAVGEPVARIPMENYLATLVRGNGTILFSSELQGFRRHEFVPTGVDGRFVSEGLPSISPGTMYLQAFQIAPDGSVARCVNQKSGGKGVTLSYSRNTLKPPELRAVVFTCKEIGLVELFDPRFLIPIPSVSVLDARKGSPPKRMNLWTHLGAVSCMLEHPVQWQMILRSGLVGNRMVLVNMKPPAMRGGETIRTAMTGFENKRHFPTHPFFVSAEDFYRIDDWRVEEYRKAGVTSKPITGVQEKTKRLIEEARDAYARNDGGAFMRNAVGALANELRAYHAVRATANDVIRGAVFLLLLLVPFSYAMERLLFASMHIYRQIGGVLGIFTVMAAILWSFHPAFRMGSMPLMVIMAFAVIVMSMMVIVMIYSKFETELRRSRTGLAETSSAKTSRFGLVSTAFKLGIANMRKRKLRTALTAVTIMLITFALLSFMSASTYVGKSEYGIDARSQQPSVLIRLPQDRVIPQDALPYLKNMVGSTRDIVPRFWWSMVDTLQAQWVLHVRHPKNGRQIALSAGLVLSGSEHRVSPIETLCPDWERFAEGRGCYCARSAAAELGVQPGDSVVVAGRMMELIGVYDAPAMDSTLKRIDGKSLMPPDYSLMGLQQMKESEADNLEQLEQLMDQTTASGDEGAAIISLSSARVIILPVQVMQNIENVSLHSVAIPAHTHDHAKTIAHNLTDKLAFPVYYTAEKSSRVITTTPLSPRAPKSILIPVLIACFIILNTMLSSLAERKGEIYIYTSLGLAPLHIGVLFLAEAFTYGLLGSIFGYIAGQGVATVFSSLGWMGELTLNFGGTQAMITMTLVLVIVVLSSLVPAYLAGKVAAPSNTITWSVPEPLVRGDTQVIADVLPFTTTRTTAPGVICFLTDYFTAHKDGAIGHFTTGDLDVFSASECCGITATVWLAPYDLGVRQSMRITIRTLHTQSGEHEIGIELTHESGQRTSWHKLNRTFLGDLRRQLLGWRKLTPEHMYTFIQRGEKLLGEKR